MAHVMLGRSPLSFSLSVYRGPFMGSTGEFRRVQCRNIVMIRNPQGRIEVYYLIDGIETFRGYSDEVTIRQGAHHNGQLGAIKPTTEAV